MGLTVLDAGVLIGLLDANDAHHPEAVTALRDAVDRADRISLPASAYAEVLVGPSRRGETAVTKVDQFVEQLPLEIVPLDRWVAATTAALRAEHRSLKLPDALVIATAKVLGADRLVTTDRGWPSSAHLGLAGALIEL